MYREPRTPPNQTETGTQITDLTASVSVIEATIQEKLQTNTDPALNRNFFSGLSQYALKELLNSKYSRIKQLAQDQLKQRGM